MGIVRWIKGTIGMKLTPNELLEEARGRLHKKRMAGNDDPKLVSVMEKLEIAIRDKQDLVAHLADLEEILEKEG